MKPTDIAASRLLPQSRRLPVGVPGSHPRPRIHPLDRRRPLQRRLHDQLEVERVSGNSRTHLRPAVRTRVPPRPRRGNAGRDLPPEARRRRLQGRRLAPDAEGRRRRTASASRWSAAGRLAHRRARSRPARLRLHGVRSGSQGRRHDADADSEIPPARRGDRRRDRLHPQPRHRVQGRPPHRQPEEAAGRELRRDLRRLRRAARPRARHSGPQGSGQEHPHRHRLAVVRLVRPRHARSASASSCSAAATPRWTAAAPPAASAATT